jgi:hypothetical protein
MFIGIHRAIFSAEHKNQELWLWTGLQIVTLGLMWLVLYDVPLGQENYVTDSIDNIYIIL